MSARYCSLYGPGLSSWSRSSPCSCRRNGMRMNRPRQHHRGLGGRSPYLGILLFERSRQTQDAAQCWPESTQQVTWSPRESTLSLLCVFVQWRLFWTLNPASAIHILDMGSDNTRLNNACWNSGRSKALWNPEGSKKTNKIQVLPWPTVNIFCEFH